MAVISVEDLYPNLPISIDLGLLTSSQLNDAVNWLKTQWPQDRGILWEFTWVIKEHGGVPQRAFHNSSMQIGLH